MIKNKLKKIRLKQGLSLRRLADDVGASHQCIKKIEDGLASPSIGNADNIAVNLDKKISDIWDLKSEAKK